MDSFEKVLPKLVEIELFSDFKVDNENDKRIMKMVYDNITIKEYKKGDVIIKEGDYGDDFFILYDGSVQIYRDTPAGDKIALANLNSTSKVFFGETALISKDTRTATVTAATDCKTIVLSSKNFISLCDKEPLLGYRVLLHLAGRMSQTIRNTNRDKAVLYTALFDEIAEL